MKVISGHATPYSRPWPKAYTAQSANRHGVILALFDTEGRIGQGEAAPLQPFTPEDHDACLKDIRHIVRSGSDLYQTTFLSPEDIRLWVDKSSSLVTVQHALEHALLSLMAATKSTTIQALLGSAHRHLEQHRLVRTPQEASEATREGCTTLKVKVSGLETEAIIGLVQGIRTATGPKTRLRLDANRSWDYSQAADLFTRLRPIGIEFIEEPLSNPSPASLAKLQLESGVPIACDESIRSLDALNTHIDSQSCQVVIIKPMFIGGIIPSIAMIQRAAEAGLGVVVTTSLDGDLARDSALLCAEACPPNALLACGLHPSSSCLTTTPDLGLKTLPHPLLAASVARPEHPALCFGKEVWSYRELRDLVALRAGELETAGIRAGARVQLSMTAKPTSIVDFWALTWLGATPVLLDPRTPRERYQKALDALKVQPLPKADDVSARQARPAPMVQTQESLILFTSGSTGRARAVSLTTEQLIFSAFGQAARIGHQLEDRWGCALPLHHIGGLSILLRTAWLHTTTVLYPGWSPKVLSDDLDSGHITMASLVPSMLSDLLNERNDRPFENSTRVILIGGAKAGEDLLKRCQRIHAPVALTWGMTEAGSQVATNVPGDLQAALAPLSTATISSERNALWIHSPLVGGAMASADNGHLDETGRVIVTGRSDDIIISGGENISLTEIKVAIEAHPHVAEAYVIGVKHAQWGERPWALVVPRKASILNFEAELRSHLSRQLGPYETPDRLVFISELPRNAMGKTTHSHAFAAFEQAQDATTPNEPATRPHV